MVREELRITVPKHFRCPISLDVMQSPVSLITGVTYDRRSIQHWLDTGHDTCPATMQVLSSKDLVPNLTLRRLISLWSPPPLPLPFAVATATSPSSTQLVVHSLFHNIKNGPDDCKMADSLVKLVDFASRSEENRRLLLRIEGFVEVIGGVLFYDVDIRVVELVIRLLYMVLNENGVRETLHSLVFNRNDSSFASHHWLSRSVSLIQSKSELDSKIESVRVLESITSINNEYKRRVAEVEELLPVLIQSVKTESTDGLNDAVLSFLISISITRYIKARLVQLGVVRALTEGILSNRNAAVSVVEKAMRMVSIVATCREGRVGISEEERCVGMVVERLLKVSKTATEDGVVVLWSLCCLDREEEKKRVREVVVRSNGLVKVVLVMQSSEGGGGCVRRMCGELVKVLRGCSGGGGGGGGGGGIGGYETKTTHIRPY